MLMFSLEAKTLHVTCVCRTLAECLMFSCWTLKLLQYLILLRMKLKGRRDQIYTIFNCMSCQMPKPRLLKGVLKPIKAYTYGFNSFWDCFA